VRSTVRSGLALFAVILALSGCSAEKRSTQPDTEVDAAGRLVFVRGDPSSGASEVYIVDADGDHLRQVFKRGANGPHWSPDGEMVSVFCCDDGMAAHFVRVADGAVRALPPASPSLETNCGPWSSDGRRVACASLGVSDPERNGIYSVRVSDGRDMQRVTSATGSDDIPGDYSPDGLRFVFTRRAAGGDVDLFVADLTGRGLHRLSPAGLEVEPFFGGSWSPVGSEVLFVAHQTPAHAAGIWLGDADSGKVQQVALAGCGGEAAAEDAADCSDPGWSPDGTKIVFARTTHIWGMWRDHPRTGEGSDLYIADADGSHVQRVTDLGDASQADWTDP
jgi:Tol biopolymer transport system component